jgi:arginine/lysine/ornithine decarboxylase
MKNSIFESLIQYNKLNRASYHVPGHKNFNFFCEKLINFDVTEFENTDNLYNPKSSILNAEQTAANLFGSKKTLFSAGGNTLCIQTMLFLCATQRDGKFLCARNVHRSVISAMALLNIQPKWILPRQNAGKGLSGRIFSEDVETALKTEAAVSGVLITSPDYYGVISDISKISKICKKYNVPLLVDNAHGAHLSFFKKNLHPTKLGASMSADSAHKTLPVLTGGAFLHIMDKNFIPAAKSAMTLFGSTSPSFLLLASLDICCKILAKNGQTLFQKLEKKVNEIKKLAENFGFTTPNGLCDPVRITLSGNTIGYSGKKLHEYLLKYQIEAEFFDENYVVLIPSPFNTIEDWEKLKNAIINIQPKRHYLAPASLCEIDYLPKIAISLREALFGKNITIPINSAKNKILSEIVCTSPPAIPPIMPGEIIGARECEFLSYSGIDKIKVLK